MLHTREFINWCNKELVRIAWVLPVGCAIQQMNGTELLEQFIDENTAGELNNIFGVTVADEAEEAAAEAEDACEVFNDDKRRDYVMEAIEMALLNGYLLLVEKAMRDYDDEEDRDSFDSSFGRCYLKYFYSPELGPDLIAEIKAWAEKKTQKDKAYVK